MRTEESDQGAPGGGDLPTTAGSSGDPTRTAEVERRFRRTLEGLLGIPATEGNLVEVLRNGDRIFPAMLHEIESATETVDLCTYVYWTGDVARRFADALADRGRAGVRVRVLLDAVGAYPMDTDLLRMMEDAGCEVRRFRMPQDVDSLAEVNDRTHRKVLVCDEDVAFIGGVGIAAEWEGDARDPSEWRDTHLRVRGPAVDGLRAAFVSNWAETGSTGGGRGDVGGAVSLFDDRDRFPEQPQPGDSVVQVLINPTTARSGWSQMRTVLTALLRRARERVSITSAYFVPDEQMLAVVREAADRGVAVRVLVPGAHTDKRVVQYAGEDRYEELLDAGVEIWRYQPTMIHAKVLTVDGVVAVVGSSNMDVRSMQLNEEADVVVFDRDVTAVLDAHFAEDLRRSERVDPDTWRRRGPVRRALHRVAGTIGDQL